MARRGVYLLPSTVTTLSLGSGFFSLINAFAGEFKIAAMLVFLSVVLDGLDGRIARATRTESRFGAEYDSLSDAVVFGCIPAFLVVEWQTAMAAGLVPGKVVYAAGLFYLATTCLRLARFNVRKDRLLFLGLPSPAAAVVIASLVLVFEEGGHYSGFSAWTAVVALFVCGACMVSNLGYYSFKQIDFSRRVRLVVLASGVVLLAFVLKDAALSLLALSLVYLLSAPALNLWRWFRKYKTARPGDDPGGPDLSG